MLYETFNTNRCNGLYNASSETIWDMKNYESRPYGWTSADAAGLAVFPGLIRYDEVASGTIHHAIRFTLPHTKDDANGGYFVEPATHAAGTDWGVSNVMGMRIRLKASFDISSFSPANQVILTAMKEYGMILADNGDYFFFQGAPDPRWNDDDLTNLDAIGSENFEVVQMTPEFPGWDSATAPTGNAPVISKFTASATSVSSGSPVTFTYTVSGDSYDYIDMIGPVTAGSGSVTISPTATRTYTLYSMNQYGDDGSGVGYGETVSTPITVTVPGSVVAPVVFTPPAGLYTSALAVTLSTPTSPYAAIYYTTDGSTPTYPISGATQAYPVTPTAPNSQGTVNSITVSATETVRAIAVVTGYSAASASSSATYTFVGSAAATPIFSVASGSYTSAQSVSISTTTPNAKIYYTTDGSDPAASPTAIKYSSAIPVSTSETINAVAEAGGYANSVIASSAYDIVLPAAMPTFLPAAGTYPAAQSVTISSTTPYAVIYYTTDGSNPAASATAVLYKGPVNVPKTETLNAIAVAGGFSNSAEGTAAYILTLPAADTPTFSPAAGTYTSAKSVTISTLTPNSTIYYTTDGSDPATSATAALYAAPIPVSPAAGSYSLAETINAVAEAAGFNNSATGTALYTINLPFNGPHYLQQCNQQASYATSVTCTLSGVGAGDTLVIGVFSSEAATVTSSSGTPTLAVQENDVYGSIFSAYLLPNTSAGSISITAKVSANETYWLSVYEYSNTSVSPLDGAAGAEFTTWEPTTFSTPNFTTTSDNDLLWTYCAAPDATIYPGWAPVTWIALPGPVSGWGTLIEEGETTTAGTYYGQCSGAINPSTPGGLSNPGIVTLALKPPSAAAELTTPAPGSALTGSSATFTWSAGNGVTKYEFLLGTTGPGSDNLDYLASYTALSSGLVSNIPTNGMTLYARLYSLINGVWQHTDYTYTEFGPASLISPTPGSTLTGSSATFNWTTGGGVTKYEFLLGATGPGSDNLDYLASATALSSGLVSDIPTNGMTLYARLYSLIGGVWQHTDYTYTEAGTPVPAALISPAPGSTLTGSTATFGWTAGGGVTKYEFLLGTTGPGSDNLDYLASATALSSGLVSNIPTYGVTVYARLYSLINGVWQYTDYTYTESGAPVPAALTSPAPGSTLTGSSATFTWTAGGGVTKYEFLLGTTGPGSDNLDYLASATALSSGLVSNIPTNGGTVYARLYSLIGGVWQHTDYTYTEQ